MAMISTIGAAADELDERAALVPAACLFRALGDPSRLVILQHLTMGEHRVVDLVAHLGLAQSTVSKHLACLRGCGLVDSRPVGRSSVFALTEPELVLRVLGVVDELLAATGEAAVLCSNAGEPRPAPGRGAGR